MQRSGSIALLLPATAFGRSRISAPELACSCYLLEAYASKRPFTRPQRLSPFENHRGEVSAPGLLLRRNSELFFQPVRLRPPTLGCVCHVPGDVHRSKPVAVSQAQNSQTSTNFRSPSGLASLGIVALGWRLILRSLPLCPARLPFAPR
jgi:hypothetical protein